MDKIEKAVKMYMELESQKREYAKIALRNFEIHSRLSKIRA